VIDHISEETLAHILPWILMKAGKILDYQLEGPEKTKELATKLR